MACRCAEMRVLRKQMDDLKLLLEKSSTFNTYNDKAISQLEKAKSNSWNATKSTSVQSDVSVLPAMTDLIEDAHASVVVTIEAALVAMSERYSDYEREDSMEEHQ